MMVHDRFCFQVGEGILVKYIIIKKNMLFSSSFTVFLLNMIGLMFTSILICFNPFSDCTLNVRAFERHFSSQE